MAISRSETLSVKSLISNPERSPCTRVLAWHLSICWKSTLDDRGSIQTSPSAISNVLSRQSQGSCLVLQQRQGSSACQDTATRAQTAHFSALTTADNDSGKLYTLLTRALLWGFRAR
jgi:hypothetical protein